MIEELPLRYSVEEMSPFDKARLNNGVPDLDERLANKMLAEVENRLGHGLTPEAEMEFVLDLNAIQDPDRRHAYKAFFGYTWAARKRKRERERDEALNREFAPPKRTATTSIE